MFPKISDLLNYGLGTTFSIPIPTWSFFISLAYTAAAVIYWLEFKRKHALGQLPAPNSLQLILLAILLIPMILIGCRLMSVIEDPSKLLSDPLNVLFKSGGMSYYGGFILGFVAVIGYAAYKRIRIWHALDVTALAILLGYSFGRLGCHFAGDGCWGIPNPFDKPAFLEFLPDWAWGETYPHNVAQSGVIMEDCIGKYCHVIPYPVFPTSLYEAAFSLLTFIILWSVRKKLKPGVLFAIFLCIYSVARFTIEFIRVNPKYMLYGIPLSQAQYISILVFLAGIITLYYLWLKKTSNPSSSFPTSLLPA